MEVKPLIICLTPVKNEEWILEKFLKCTSIWADVIILADQQSTDNTKLIAAKFPKVKLINNSDGYNESSRQKLLIDEARKYLGPRLLIALDADEFLSSNFLTSPEWKTVLNAKPGTIINFKWANITKDFKKYWSPKGDKYFGFMDDGSNNLKSNMIHNLRIPMPDNAPVINLNEIKVMHYQYTDWNRMLMKHKWYLCFERIRNRKASAINLYRQYHHMFSIPKGEFQDLPSSWFEGYENLGINMTSVIKEKHYWWEKEIFEFFDNYQIITFAKENLWDIDWSKIAAKNNYTNPEKYKDPRNIFVKLIHKYLKITQKFNQFIFIRAIDRFLTLFF